MEDNIRLYTVLKYSKQSDKFIPCFNSFIGFFGLSQDEVISKKIDTSNATDLSGCFAKCKNLKKILYLDLIKTDNVESIDCLFAKDSNLNNYSGIEIWNLSKCNSCNFAFAYSGIDSLKYFKYWKFAKDCSCVGMFQFTKINNLKGILHIDFKNIKSTKNMFAGILITSLKGSEGLDLSKCSDVDNMFTQCNRLSDISVASTWKLPKGVELKTLFKNCSLLKFV